MVANRMPPHRHEHRSAVMSNVLFALQGRLTSASYALAWWLVCRLPESWGRRVFAKAGEIASRRQGPRGQGLEANPRPGGGPEPRGQGPPAPALAGTEVSA